MLRATVTSREQHHGAEQVSGPSPDETTHTSESLGAVPSPHPLREPHSIPATELRDPGRYKILAEHGRGGLGRVSRAHDRDLGRDIAIKELIAGGHVREMRFLREALITARLEHPGIVPVYEAGRWPDGTPFYAMKLVAGRSLRDLLAERATFEERISLLHHVIAVADAIAYAHDRNIIHRDLKPANIIVGDFGETIVIDWGLAKDLTAAEDTGVEAGPFRSPGDDGLTSTGSVLGTPAYMAPEQQRGEPVDQRADVHAIGVMLWELCTAQKLPPRYTGQRGTLLRRAGIDSDLASIIEKSLDPAPDRRYPHAGALAADLKAFKAGARISARRYSLFAMLAHWARRHRAIAVSVATAAALGASGVVTYVRHIAAERDRVSTANNALIFEHAKLLLQSDPTAAFETLQLYTGIDTTHQELLRAQARGMGLALLRASPHTLSILFAHTLNDGTLITLGLDGLVVKTSLAGIRSRIIAHSELQKGIFDFSSNENILIFSCNISTICLLDVRTERLLTAPNDISTFEPVGLTISPNAHFMAAISAHGEIRIWYRSQREPPVIRFETRLSGVRSARFIDDWTLAIQFNDSVQIFRLDAAGKPFANQRFELADIITIKSSQELHMLVASTTTGHIVVIDTQTSDIVLDRVVCSAHVSMASILPTRRAIAFACPDGNAGVVDLAQKAASVLTRIEGGVAVVAGSADGRYLLAGGHDGSIAVYDFETQISSIYRGHGTRLTTLQGPAPTFPWIVSTDSGGELRIWPLPETAASVAIKTTARMFRAVPFPSDGSIIAIGSSSKVFLATHGGRSEELPGHNPAHSLVALSGKQRHAVLYGFDDVLELWSFEGEPTSRTLQTGHRTTVAVGYAPDGQHFIVASDDGTLTEWFDEGTTSQTLATINEPIVFMRFLRAIDAIAIGGASGALWIYQKQHLRYLGHDPESIASVVVSPNSRWLAVASPHGIVHLYDTETLATSTFRSPRDSNQFLFFTPDNAQLVIATDETISTMALPYPTTMASTDGRHWSWNEADLSIKHLDISSDNEWFAATSDHGGIWFNRRGSNRWIYLSVGRTRISFGAFSTTNDRFIATDIQGRALSVDMRAGVFTSDASVTTR